MKYKISLYWAIRRTRCKQNFKRNLLSNRIMKRLKIFTLSENKEKSLVNIDPTPTFHCLNSALRVTLNDFLICRKSR